VATPWVQRDTQALRAKESRPVWLSSKMAGAACMVVLLTGGTQRNHLLRNHDTKMLRD